MPVTRGAVFPRGGGWELAVSYLLASDSGLRFDERVGRAAV